MYSIFLKKYKILIKMEYLNSLKFLRLPNIYQ